MKFRLHRGSLEEAMKSLIELDPSVAALLAHLNEWAEGSFEFKVEDLRLKYTGSDRRIAWEESWYVYFEGFGVVGMSDSIPADAPETAFDRYGNPVDETVVRFRPNLGSYQKSLIRSVDLPPKIEALEKHLSDIHSSPIEADLIRITPVKSDRRIGWYNHWRVEVIGQGVVGFMNGMPTDIPHHCLRLKAEKELKVDDDVKVTVHAMESLPKGLSPYAADPFRSGVPLSAGWEIMFESSKPVLHELVAVNLHSGQRILLAFEPLAVKQY